MQQQQRQRPTERGVRGVVAREVTCKSVLHEMYGTKEYTANLYRGCTHGCVYCYAPSLIHDERKWGNYVDVKVNAAEILERELRRVRRGTIFLSSASDPYQPIEAKYGVTRRALKALLRHRFPLSILTRSPLVLRDLDLLREFAWVRVGCSISGFEGRTFEPRVVPVKRRLETLRALNEAGIKTYVSLAPLVTGMIDWEGLLAGLKKAGVCAVVVGALRFDGYGDSKEFFERETGISSWELLADARETSEDVRNRVAELGFEPASSFFRWEEQSRIDKYIRPVEGSSPID